MILSNIHYLDPGNVTNGHSRTPPENGSQVVVLKQISFRKPLK
jgi:hypothetical protein